MGNCESKQNVKESTEPLPADDGDQLSKPPRPQQRQKNPHRPHIQRPADHNHFHGGMHEEDTCSNWMVTPHGGRERFQSVMESPPLQSPAPSKLPNGSFQYPESPWQMGQRNNTSVWNDPTEYTEDRDDVITNPETDYDQLPPTVLTTKRLAQRESQQQNPTVSTVPKSPLYKPAVPQQPTKLKGIAETHWSSGTESCANSAINSFEGASDQQSPRFLSATKDSAGVCSGEEAPLLTRGLSEQGMGLTEGTNATVHSESTLKTRTSSCQLENVRSWLGSMEMDGGGSFQSFDPEPVPSPTVLESAKETM